MMAPWQAVVRARDELLLKLLALHITFIFELAGARSQVEKCRTLTETEASTWNAAECWSPRSTNRVSRASRAAMMRATCWLRDPLGKQDCASQCESHPAPLSQGKPFAHSGLPFSTQHLAGEYYC